MARKSIADVSDEQGDIVYQWGYCSRNCESWRLMTRCSISWEHSWLHSHHVLWPSCGRKRIELIANSVRQCSPPFTIVAAAHRWRAIISRFSSSCDTPPTLCTERTSHEKKKIPGLSANSYCNEFRKYCWEPIHLIQVHRRQEDPLLSIGGEEEIQEVVFECLKFLNKYLQHTTLLFLENLLFSSLKTIAPMSLQRNYPMYSRPFRDPKYNV